MGGGDGNGWPLAQEAAAKERADRDKQKRAELEAKLDSDPKAPSKVVKK